VFLVDDDPRVLRALARLLSMTGFQVRPFLSASEFLRQHQPDCVGCIVADVVMPDMSGLELQQALLHSRRDRPIIFITGQGDVPTSVRAMKQGALDFLTKPVKHRELIAAIRAAVETDRRLRQERQELRSIEARFAALTHRESEVLSRVVEGRLNKQIAHDLGVAEKTIKVHRARVMAKTGARSLAELVRIAHRAGATGNVR
jgi:FixJ family two-component response regulator